MITVYQFFHTKWWKSKPVAKRHRFFDDNHRPAHKPGYYLGHEWIYRNMGHYCNSACDIRTLRHWMQND